MTEKEQFLSYIEICEAAEKIHQFPRDLNSLIYLKDQDKISIFKIVEFEVFPDSSENKNDVAYIQVSNEVDLNDISDISIDFFKKLFDGDFNSDMIHKNIKKVDFIDLKNYGLIITMEHIFYALRDKGYDDKKIFFDIYQEIDRSAGGFSFLDDFNTGNLALYVRLIVYYMALSSYRYHFPTKLFLLKNEIDKTILNLM